MSVIVKAGLKQKQQLVIYLFYIWVMVFTSHCGPPQKLQRRVILNGEYTEILMQIDKRKTSIKTNVLCVCVFFMGAAILVAHLGISDAYFQKVIFSVIITNSEVFFPGDIKELFLKDVKQED